MKQAGVAFDADDEAWMKLVIAESTRSSPLYKRAQAESLCVLKRALAALRRDADDLTEHQQKALDRLSHRQTEIYKSLGIAEKTIEDTGKI